MSAKADYERTADLDLDELRRRDRARFGGILPYPIAATNTRRADARRCNSQTCCNGSFAIAELSDWEIETDLGSDEYRNGTEKEA